MRHQKSIELLNLSVADELQAVHQYMYFHFVCDDLGYDIISNFFRRTAIQEMMHVEQLSERILFLKGEVDMVPAGNIEHIHDVADMLKKAVEMEEKSVSDYNNFAIECAKNADSITKQLFERLVGEEEVHLDQFDTELDNMNKLGNNYLALQAIERSKANSMAPLPAGE